MLTRSLFRPRRLSRFRSKKVRLPWQRCDIEVNALSLSGLRGRGDNHDRPVGEGGKQPVLIQCQRRGCWR